MHEVELRKNNKPLGFGLMKWYHVTAGDPRRDPLVNDEVVKACRNIHSRIYRKGLTCESCPLYKETSGMCRMEALTALDVVKTTQYYREVRNICRKYNDDLEISYINRETEAAKPEPVHERTILDQFKEVYPNADFNKVSGAPECICPCELGLEVFEPSMCRRINHNSSIEDELAGCKECWNRPIWVVECMAIRENQRGMAKRTGKDS